MNITNLNQIFDEYIKQFSIINNDENKEYRKWQSAYQFPILMKNALKKEGAEFVAGLEIVRKCTEDLIDQKMESFKGMVQLSRKEPETVKMLFQNLYEEDQGNLEARSKRIAEFITMSNELLEQYYEDEGTYLQNDQSAMAYLFFMNPDDCFMYEGPLSRRFGDVIEYFEDWGEGIHMNLSLYYHMCEQVLEQLMENPVIRFLDMSRFDGRLAMAPGELHPDTKKHILLYDIMHTMSVYHMDQGISYKKISARDRRRMLQEIEDAKPIINQYKKAKADADELNEIMEYVLDSVKSGDGVRHSRFGSGKIEEISKSSILIYYPEAEKRTKLVLPVILANRVVHFENPDVEARLMVYEDVLKRYEQIPRTLKYAEEKLEPYRKYMSSI